MFYDPYNNYMETRLNPHFYTRITWDITKTAILSFSSCGGLIDITQIN